MPPSRPEDDIGSLEKARERLYRPQGGPSDERTPLPAPGTRFFRHLWGEDPLPHVQQQGVRHMRLAGIFFIGAFLFFLLSLGVAGAFFYFGGNSVSVDKIDVDIQGPTTIAGGDIVPLSITVTNRNPTTVDNATIEINFPEGTRSVDDVLLAYPRYTENLGSLASGESVIRSIKAVVFGGAGQALALPISLSFRTSGSNAVFVKKSSYALGVSSTPLSLSVETLAETVSGAPLTVNVTVRSNATVPISNVVLAANFPFGFSVTSSSLPVTNSSFLLGTIAPGATKTVTLTGTLLGQDTEQRVFNFTVGTAKTATDQALAVTYMTQSAAVVVAAPFIHTTLALNGDTRADAVVSAGSLQSVTVTYTNTLATSITNAVVTVAVSGSAVDYDSIRSSNGFYNSSDHSIVFSRDTDPSLAQLSPNASGIGAFTFSTLPANSLAQSPAVIFTISVSGTRIGQANVPENVSSTMTKIVKVATTVAFSAYSLHRSGPFGNTGPIPPKADQATTYTVMWNVQNTGSAVAGGAVSATLPVYVSYTEKTGGAGSFSYDDKSRTVTWNTGDFAQGASAQGAFQVSLTPSTSQKGSAPALTSTASFSGYDRFAGVQVKASAEPVTTETTRDPGYVLTNAIVQ
ncbi:hypothetical protein A3C19_03070 [Candidatus Kaiserbacteria bacterium RIFCSPHIGHO2_02_FULL_54_22]|uniref:DUF11 domain-containing protein n=1 Tax=Candidatus Kaiserbacteria bacterium RIFCSPHIGHO2_02_FULL_54_22 TaxID=1798495 RepID=A0A1F6DLA9_9BACT|nr:MAG: hypothetical protein A3C19_03070 [Candidatus Kaiserbacteria bacterium RIFCSPHIGHO2_02_FULL_54_22]OGG68267.1 MAG: hypothetical protein A3E99_00885 [Candidatus Kaiserbacteria bacterium RIFCSPHIGHO2_12_FULL_54_16]OGG89837.1 MAG: hypothetical protein A3G12_02625 [Candidatus Kaiserbacteria bacterium RIFCSPLOWO2_12_FULL_54_10]